MGTGVVTRFLVLPWRGACLDELEMNELPIATRMSAARQLLEALESLHKAGIVHRNLHDRNCFWAIVPLHHLSKKAKYQLLGRPCKEGLWKPREMVMPLKVPADLHTGSFYLGDFGLAMKLCDPEDPAQEGLRPIEFCSPDRLHKELPITACDMWGYMCIFAEVYLGFVPFTFLVKSGVITSVVTLLGPLPPKKWKGNYLYPESSNYSWYDQNNKPSADFNLGTQIARARPDVDSTEQKLVYSILTREFNYDPEKRLSATQLLQDISLNALINRYSPLFIPLHFLLYCYHPAYLNTNLSDLSNSLPKNFAVPAGINQEIQTGS